NRNQKQSCLVGHHTQIMDTKPNWNNQDKPFPEYFGKISESVKNYEWDHCKGANKFHVGLKACRTKEVKFQHLPAGRNSPLLLRPVTVIDPEANKDAEKDSI